MSGNGKAPALVERLTDVEAERYVLGAVLLGYERPDALARELERTDFWREAHRVLFDVIGQLGTGVDPVAANARARALGKAGAALTTREITEIVGDAQHAFRSWPDVAQQVRKMAALRGLANTAQAALSELATCDLLDDGLADRVDGALSSATRPLRRRRGPYRGPHSPERLADNVRAQMDSDVETTPVFVSIFPGLDRFVKAPVGAPLYVGGDTSDGKSSVALSAAEVWADQGEQVVYHTFEDIADAMHYRQLSCRTGATFDDVTQAIYANRNDELKRCIRAWEDYFVTREGTILFDDTVGATVERLRMSDRDFERDGYTRFIYDHLGDIPPPDWMRGKDDTSIFRYNALGLRDLVKELNVANMILSQLNREGARAEHPTMKAFYMAGAVEQTARAAVIIRRPDREDAGQRWHVMELHVVKVTNGKITPKGYPARMVFEPARTWVREPWAHERSILAKFLTAPLYETLAKYQWPHSPGGLHWPGEDDPASSAPRREIEEQFVL